MSSLDPVLPTGWVPRTPQAGCRVPITLPAGHPGYQNPSSGGLPPPPPILGRGTMAADRCFCRITRAVVANSHSVPCQSPSPGYCCPRWGIRGFDSVSVTGVGFSVGHCFCGLPFFMAHKGLTKRAVQHTLACLCLCHPLSSVFLSQGKCSLCSSLLPLRSGLSFIFFFLSFVVNLLFICSKSCSRCRWPQLLPSCFLLASFGGSTFSLDRSSGSEGAGPPVSQPLLCILFLSCFPM